MAANQVPSIYRSSAFVILRLRFEEYDSGGELAARLSPLAPGAAPVAQTTPAAATTPASAEAISAQLAGLDQTIEGAQQLVDSGFSPPSLLTDLQQQRQALVAQLGQDQAPVSGGSPLSYSAGPDPDGRTIVTRFAPKSVSIKRNDYRTADEATITMSYRDLPLDARVVRAAHVTIVLGVVSPEDWERGMAGGVREDGNPYSWPVQTDPNSTTFTGYVDSPEMSLTGDGDEVTLECRDNTALPANTLLATGTAIDLTLPLDQGVTAFLRQYPAFQTTPPFEVFYGRPGARRTDAPIPANAAPTVSAPRQRRGGSGQRGGQVQHRSSGTRQTVWDAICDVCNRVGVIPLWILDELWIIDPRVWWSDRAVARRLVYGQWLSEFVVSRHLGLVTVPTIELRSYDPDIGRTRWARYPTADGAISAGIMGTGPGATPPPQTPQRVTTPSVSGWNPAEQIETHSVQPVTDLDVLRGMARSFFQQRGRAELEGHIKTDIMQSSSPETSRLSTAASAPQPDFADLISLMNGDAIEILIAGAPGAPAPSTSGLSAAELAAMEVSRRAAYLVNLGWSQRAADQFSRAQQALAGQTTFRVKEVQLDWDVDEGTTIGVDFLNYIELRVDGHQTANDPPVGQVVAAQLQPTADVDQAARLAGIQAQRDAITALLANGGITPDAAQQQLAQISDQETQVRQGSA